MQEVTDSNFEAEVVDGSKNSIVLVDYYSTSCAPCTRLLPKLENVDAKLLEHARQEKIVKVNVENNIESSMRNMVRTIPTLVVYKDGEVIEVLRGCSQITEDAIESLLNY